MSSITFNGHDFGAFTTCKVDEGAHAIAPTAKEIPGRAGELLLSSRVPPRVLRVKLFLDPTLRPDAAALSELRHRLYAWLASDGGAVLKVPGDPGLEWHDAVCTAATPWTSAEEDATCELEFTCFDPIAYGGTRNEVGTTFEVGGTWPTWPAFELTAEAGSYVQITHGGEAVRIERAFSGGETVLVDCEREIATVDGDDARADVALASDFFCLEPGDCAVAYSGCSAHTATFSERWL